mmetsp:Transcript_30403/g.84781  ORF Transcript_30403/g.84781 Transcript_30403/m.84781 type:complete len:228 (+) Transcript_30403:277-960(+)
MNARIECSQTARVPPSFPVFRFTMGRFPSSQPSARLIEGEMGQPRGRTQRLPRQDGTTLYSSCLFAVSEGFGQALVPRSIAARSSRAAARFIRKPPFDPLFLDCDMSGRKTGFSMAPRPSPADSSCVSSARLSTLSSSSMRARSTTFSATTKPPSSTSTNQSKWSRWTFAMCRHRRRTRSHLSGEDPCLVGSSFATSALKAAPSLLCSSHSRSPSQWLPHVSRAASA